MASHFIQSKSQSPCLSLQVLHALLTPFPPLTSSAITLQVTFSSPALLVSMLFLKQPALLLPDCLCYFTGKGLSSAITMATLLQVTLSWLFRIPTAHQPPFTFRVAVLIPLSCFIPPPIIFANLIILFLGLLSVSLQQNVNSTRAGIWSSAWHILLNLFCKRQFIHTELHMTVSSSFD